MRVGDEDVTRLGIHGDRDGIQDWLGDGQGFQLKALEVRPVRFSVSEVHEVKVLTLLAGCS